MEVELSELEEDVEPLHDGDVELARRVEEAPREPPQGLPAVGAPLRSSEEPPQRGL